MDNRRSHGFVKLGCVASPLDARRVPAELPIARIMVVDDHEIVRLGLESVLQSHAGYRVVAQAHCVRDAVRRAAAVTPGMIITDVALPDGTAIDVMNTLAHQHISSLFICYSSSKDPQVTYAAWRAGAAAFVNKAEPVSVLLSAVEQVLAGKVLLDAKTVARTPHHPSQKLTLMQRKVLDLMGQGLSNQQIAKRLGIAEKTVKNHVTRMFSTMGFCRRSQAAAWVASHQHDGLWQPPASH